MLTPAAAYALARDLGRRHAATVPALDDAQPCSVDSQGENFRPCTPLDGDGGNFDDDATEFVIWKRIEKVTT